MLGIVDAELDWVQVLEARLGLKAGADWTLEAWRWCLGSGAALGGSTVKNPFFEIVER